MGGQGKGWLMATIRDNHHRQSSLPFRSGPGYMRSSHSFSETLVIPLLLPFPQTDSGVSTMP